MYDVEQLAKDFTPTGVKLEGQYENDRNSVFSDLYKAIISEVYDCKDVIIGHHLIYVKEDKRPDGFVYQVVQEIPSADALIFDHDVARKIWGTGYGTILCELALCPVKYRDRLLSKLFYGRKDK